MSKVIVSILFLSLAAGVTNANAQLKKNKTDISAYRGPVFEQHDPSEGANIGNLFNMTMSHTYTMTFGSAGGQYRNLNIYTNTMRFYFSERLTGRLDISVLHSPFGSSPFVGLGGDKRMKIMIRNAELNYQISENSSLHIRYRRYPLRYRRTPFGSFGALSPFQPIFR